MSLYYPAFSNLMKHEQIKLLPLPRIFDHGMASVLHIYSKYKSCHDSQQLLNSSLHLIFLGLKIFAPFPCIIYGVAIVGPFP